MTTPPSPTPPTPTPVVNARTWGADLIRTGVTLGVGVLAAWAAKAGLNINSAAAITAISAAVAGVYNGAITWLEVKFPWAGRFLGAKNPTPSKPKS